MCARTRLGSREVIRPTQVYALASSHLSHETLDLFLTSEAAEAELRESRATLHLSVTGPLRPTPATPSRCGDPDPGARWCPLLAARNHKTSTPAWGAPVGWQTHCLDGEVTSRDQP